MNVPNLSGRKYTDRCKPARGLGQSVLLPARRPLAPPRFVLLWVCCSAAIGVCLAIAPSALARPLVPMATEANRAWVSNYCEDREGCVGTRAERCVKAG